MGRHAPSARDTRSRNAPAATTRSHGVFPRARTVGHVAGVAIRLDPSLLVVGVLVVVLYAQQFDDVGTATSVVMATTAMVLFFASILGHELAHALEALHRGIRVRGITMFALGGVTEMELEAPRARDEFAVSAVGPWSSLVIAAAFGLLATGADLVGWDEVAQVLGIIGWTNLAVALFNMVPGAPLDGGRVLRAAAWALTGDRHRANTIAARVGQLIALALVAGALWVLVDGGDLVAGVWLGLVGLYLLRGATGELRAGRVEARLAGHDAAALAVPAVVVAAGTTVAEVRDHLHGLRDRDVVLVRGRDGALAPAGVHDLRQHPDDGADVADLAGEPVEPVRLPGSADARTLATTVDRAGVVAVGLPDGREVLTTRLAVDARISAVLDGTS